MLKKLCCFALFVGLFATDLCAAPTIRRASSLGPASTLKPLSGSVTGAPKANKLNSNDISSARVSAIKGIYSVKNTHINTNNANKPNNQNTNNNNISNTDLTSITDRVSALESKTENIINDVQSGSGTYVTGVSVNGNKINVEKSDELYVPVRTGASDTITGSAEIWIVK